MKFVVFGASGRVGQKVVARLLDDGHEVRAFVHRHNIFQPTSGLEVIQGDIHQPGDVAAAIAGREVVISTLGSWGTPTKDILTVATTHIITAMQSAGLSRVISLTGSAAFDAGDRPAWVDRLNRRILMVVAPQILADGERHLALLRASGLDWTVVRSPVMVSGGDGNFTLNTKFPPVWATVKRDDVVSALIGLALSSEWRQSAPFVRSNRP